jgi:hypothetical protein
VQVLDKCIRKSQVIALFLSVIKKVISIYEKAPAEHSTKTFFPEMGSGVGFGVGGGVGEGVGAGVGDAVGFGVGDEVGKGVGEGVGALVGAAVGEGVGAVVGL